MNSIFDMIPEWVNKCNGILAFGYVTDSDRFDILSVLEYHKPLFKRAVVSDSGGSIGLSDSDVGVLRTMKLKNRMFVSDLENVINVSDQSHSRMVLSSLTNASSVNNNCIILLCPMYRTIDSSGSNLSFRYSSSVIYSATLALSLNNDVLSVRKIRWDDPTKYKPESVVHIIRERKIDSLLG